MGKKDVATITQSAGLAARALARLEAEASAIHEAERERRLQLVSSPGSLSALIKADGDDDTDRERHVCRHDGVTMATYWIDYTMKNGIRGMLSISAADRCRSDR